MTECLKMPFSNCLSSFEIDHPKFLKFYLSWKRDFVFTRVATNPENIENLENSGNLRDCQNLRENSGKMKNVWHNCKWQCIPANSSLSIEWLRKKFENTLEISGKAQEFSFQKCGHPVYVGISQRIFITFELLRCGSLNLWININQWYIQALWLNNFIWENENTSI